jgi:hypothetical protein
MIFEEVFDCIYSAQGESGEESFEVPLDHYACFSKINNEIKKYSCASVDYQIYLYEENLENHQFNLCNKFETRKILKCLQKTVPFNYKFTKGTFTLGKYNNKTTHFNILNIHITGTFPQHLWITSMLRCFFEWPFNIAAKEACMLQSNLKKVDGLDLSKENWINLYLSMAAQLGSYRLHGVVNASKHPKCKSYHEWNQIIASLKKDIPVIDQINKQGKPLIEDSEIRIYDKKTFNEGVESRASKYVAAYKDKKSW